MSGITDQDRGPLGVTSLIVELLLPADIDFSRFGERWIVLITAIHDAFAAAQEGAFIAIK